MLEEQARAADAQELHKKELELKRLRAVDNKEKRRLLKERKELEAEFADANRLQEMQDNEIDAKLSKEYNEMKREHETKMDSWRQQQKLKIKDLTKELRLQVGGPLWVWADEANAVCRGRVARAKRALLRRVVGARACAGNPAHPHAVCDAHATT
jgi:hypothetical protein